MKPPSSHQAQSLWYFKETNQYLLEHNLAHIFCMSGDLG